MKTLISFRMHLRAAFTALVCLVLLMASGSGCGAVGFTDGHLKANAVTLFKEPKLGPMVAYHHTKDETTFLAVLDYDGKTTITGSEVATLITAAAKIITLIP